jgi:hypothetical protein
MGLVDALTLTLLTTVAAAVEKAEGTICWKILMSSMQGEHWNLARGALALAFDAKISALAARLHARQASHHCAVISIKTLLTFTKLNDLSFFFSLLLSHFALLLLLLLLIFFALDTSSSNRL